MKRAYRIASQHKRQLLSIDSNPVTRACRKSDDESAKSVAAQEFASQILTTRIRLMDAQDGEDATELLSRLAVVIGTPCEAGAREHGHTEPWVRQLHGALRTIQTLCLQGYTWQAQWARALDRAVEVASEQRHELDPNTFALAWVEACYLATQIMNHTVDADAIAA